VTLTRAVPRLHRAWIVAAVGLLALVGAAGFGAAPGVLIRPLQEEFGWSRGTIGIAISINLILYGLTAPFAAAAMERFGMRGVMGVALGMISLGAILPIFMSHSWQLIVTWGVMVGLGTGAMALSFVATLTGRWFVKQRGLVTGVLTAGGATGRLIFLPLLAGLSVSYGWRTAAVAVGVAAVAIIPLVLLFVRNYPRDVGLRPYGADPEAVESAVPTPHPAAGKALSTLRYAARSRAFWLLVGGFAICGISTNGLIQIHLIPAAHDHGMSEPVAAGLLAMVGVLDIVGTIASGWLTDRLPVHVLLGIYYALRGASLLVLPFLLSATVQPSLLFFIIFYGLDWVATVPPTIALCRRHFGDAGPIVFGWVFASHQIGAAIAATGAGLIRDSMGSYTLAFTAAGLLCFLAAAMSMSIGAPRRADREQADRTDDHDERITAGESA
jgi:predicted MFS family arabinose efflux permease